MEKHKKPENGSILTALLKYAAVLVMGIIVLVVIVSGCGGEKETSAQFVPAESFTAIQPEPESEILEEQSQKNEETQTAKEDTKEEEQIPRFVYLTFDDGPSRNTAKVLEILEKYNVKATFFVVGYEDEESAGYYRRIIEEGHTLAMHSYTHDYGVIYADMEAYARDVQSLSDLLTEATGIEPVFYRFPGGSSNSVSQIDIEGCKQYLSERGIVYFDWNVSSGDGSNATTPEAIIENVVNGVRERENSVVLLHDSASKENTVAALEDLIQRLQEMKVTFLPITEDTVPVQHR